MTCTDWSIASGLSAFRCSQKPVRDGRCAIHLRYPDRVPAAGAPVERKP